MKQNRLIAIGAVLLMVAIPALAWLLGVEPQLRQAGAANADREQAESINAAHEAKLVELQALEDRMDELETELAGLSRHDPGECRRLDSARSTERARRHCWCRDPLDHG